MFEANPDAFDAVLTDFTMPDMTGIQFASKVMEIREGMPVSIMTGNANSLENSPVLCISKPMQMRELADHMVELLKHGMPVDRNPGTRPVSEAEL
jgi:DNA-binding NtrC family response regulator